MYVLFFQSFIYQRTCVACDVSGRLNTRDVPVCTCQWFSHDSVAEHIHGGLQLWQYNLCLRRRVLRQHHGDVEGRESVPARDGDVHGAHGPHAFEF